MIFTMSINGEKCTYFFIGAPEAKKVEDIFFVILMHSLL